MTQVKSNAITQALLGSLLAGVVMVLGQIYAIDLKIAENQKYLVLIDAIQANVGNNAHRLDRIEEHLFNDLRKEVK